MQHRGFRFCSSSVKQVLTVAVDTTWIRSKIGGQILQVRENCKEPCGHKDSSNSLLEASLSCKTRDRWNCQNSPIVERRAKIEHNQKQVCTMTAKVYKPATARGSEMRSMIVKQTCIGRLCDALSSYVQGYVAYWDSFYDFWRICSRRPPLKTHENIYFNS